MINNLLILGDSYSTFEKQIPQGYSSYYYPRMVDPEKPVRKMELDETWWRRFMKRTGANLVLNDSWSGTTICHTGYNNADCSKTHSFIFRYRRLYDEGFFEKNKIDTVIVFGGTNDNWAKAPIGELTFSDWKEEDLFSVFPAIGYLMYRLRTDIPAARIIFIANCDLNGEIVECMKRSGEHFGVEVVTLSGIEKQLGHPTPKGMEQICDQLISALGE